jgi:hypothetical protein
MRATIVAGMSCASMLAPGAWARDDQHCAAAQFAPVNAWLAKHPWPNGETRPDALVADACNTTRIGSVRSIVAAAYRPQIEDDVGEWNTIVAVVEPRRGRVLAVFTGTIGDGDGGVISQGSLRIDTARYDLAPGVRAFGVDVSSHPTRASCGESGAGPFRTLYVQDGSSLRPVLDVTLSSWRVVSGKACPNVAKDDEFGIIERTRQTISVTSQATNGYANLVLNQTIDEAPAPRKHIMLRYDGSHYRATDADNEKSTISPDPPRPPPD